MKLKFKLGEGFYSKDKWGYDVYYPEKDSKFRRLSSKPLNTLTEEEVRYIYGVENARYMQLAKWYEDVEDSVSDTRFDREDFKECADWLHSLSFPLTVYRAVWDSTDLSNICGKHHDICWTTDIDIFRNERSKFRKATRIVRGIIDNPKIINVPLTISRFLHYTGRNNDQGYGEFEINLKPNYKNSDVKDLSFIDKNTI